MADRLLPQGATETWLEHHGGRIRVLQGGSLDPDPRTDRLPVLLIHGGGYDNAAISWSKIFGPLSADRLVIAPDLPGFGYTEGLPVTGDVDELADLIITVARAFGLSRVAVAGLSMGGDIALHVALRHAEGVAGLILVAPGGLAERLRNRRMQFGAWLAAQLPDPVLFGAGRLAGRFTDSYLRRLVHDPSTVDAAVRAEFAREARRPGSGIGYGRYNQATLGPGRMRNNLLAEVFRIAVPTLFLHGEDDTLVDPANSLAAVEAMPRAELVLVGQCGHWLPIEAPEIFVSEVTDFLVALP
ncbi:MAG TPA: alpha/beta hydrolase [Microlunatus sp.]|nr:alpha/beta hydrolase [Microlunatus sp.]